MPVGSIRGCSVAWYVCSKGVVVDKAVNEDEEEANEDSPITSRINLRVLYMHGSM